MTDVSLNTNRRHFIRFILPFFVIKKYSSGVIFSGLEMNCQVFHAEEIHKFNDMSRTVSLSSCCKCSFFTVSTVFYSNFHVNFIGVTAECSVLFYLQTWRTSSHSCCGPRNILITGFWEESRFCVIPNEKKHCGLFFYWIYIVAVVFVFHLWGDTLWFWLALFLIKFAIYFSWLAVKPWFQQLALLSCCRWYVAWMLIGVSLEI